MLASFPFALYGNLRVSGVSTFYLDPSSNVTLVYDHMIAGVTKSGLKSNTFWAHNSPRSSICLPGETTVRIAACPQIFKVRTTQVPSVQDDHRSHDLDGSFNHTIEISSLESIVRIPLSLIDDCDRFRNLEFQNFESQTLVFVSKKSSKEKYFLTLVPFDQRLQSLRFFGLQGFEISNLAFCHILIS
jgi:hypothetical protein